MRLQIAWYENDGSGNFGTQQIITTDANYAKSVYAADLDNDGDIDVLSASYGDNKIAWYENDGSGNFGIQQIITTDAITHNLSMPPIWTMMEIWTYCRLPR
ncbi:MAG: VCBS repeat-containing protein [Sphingobacteriales bacterium]|nr:VCBS repeat-containing protein [Sphingobacteriales bacterium]